MVIGKRNDSRARAPYVHTSHFMTFLHVAIFAQLLANGVRGIAQVLLTKQTALHFLLDFSCEVHLSFIKVNLNNIPRQKKNMTTEEQRRRKRERDRERQRERRRNATEEQRQVERKRNRERRKNSTEEYLAGKRERQREIRRNGTEEQRQRETERRRQRAENSK